MLQEIAAGYRLGDRYRLEALVASGGMGTVWRATDELLDRVVALKQVRMAGLDAPHAETARQRVLREARVAARLHHPNAVTVFDVIIDRAQPWLVLEYVRSQSLGDRMREQGPLDPAEVARIGCCVADALAAANGRGIVHRDVKPDNILLGAAGAVKLTDFGISRAVGDLSLTASGMLVGTPAYLAPEVAAGLAATAASDVFGLGATLYAAVEGAPPFGSGDDGNVLALLRKVTEGRVVPPVRAGALTGPLMRLLDPDPARRPAATEVAGLLRSASTNTAVRRPAATVPWYRRGVVLTGTAMVMTVVLVGTAAVLDARAPGGGSALSTAPAPAPAAAAWPAPLPPCDQSHGELVVGMIGPLTGDDGARGREVRNAAELAVKEANLVCTVPGYRLVLRPLDDMSTAETAGAAAQTLRADPALVGVIGPLRETTTEAVQRVLHEAGVVGLSGTAAADRLTRGTESWPQRPFPEYFRLSSMDAVQGRVAAQHVFGARSMRSAAVVTDDSSWANAMAAEFVRRATDLRSDGIVLRDTALSWLPDHAALVTRIAAVRPDAVYFAGEDAVAAGLATQLTAAGVTAPLIGPDDIATAAFLQGGARDGDTFTSTDLPDSMLPGAASFESGYRTMGFAEPSGGYGALSYDATRVLINAVAALTAHGPWRVERRAELVRAVQRTDLPGAAGRITFDAFGDAMQPALTVWEIRGNAPVPLAVSRPFS